MHFPSNFHLIAATFYQNLQQTKAYTEMIACINTTQGARVQNQREYTYQQQKPVNHHQVQQHA